MMRMTDHSDLEGRLPASAPLANPFVPYQMENPTRYEAKKGLVRGTMYPGLDLPFMGMINKNELPDSPMANLQALAFAIQELALYLDTHKEDQEALAQYRSYQEMYERCTLEFRKKYGPLNHHNVSTDERYAWLDEPWPWEYKNKED